MSDNREKVAVCYTLDYGGVCTLDYMVEATRQRHIFYCIKLEETVHVPVGGGETALIDLSTGHSQMVGSNFYAAHLQ
jgi:hypothetical protein